MPTFLGLLGAGGCFGTCVTSTEPVVCISCFGAGAGSLSLNGGIPRSSQLPCYYVFRHLDRRRERRCIARRPATITIAAAQHRQQRRRRQIGTGLQQCPSHRGGLANIASRLTARSKNFFHYELQSKFAEILIVAFRGLIEPHAFTASNVPSGCTRAGISLSMPPTIEINPREAHWTR